MAIDEFLVMSRKPNSTITYSGFANATGADIVKTVANSAGTHMNGMTIMETDDGTKGGTSVVDPDCKVYGTDNLFVVDAGMHADIPTGNTMAIVIVAAEHAVQKVISLDTGATNPGTGNSTAPTVPTSTIVTPIATSVANATSTVLAPTGDAGVENGTMSILPTGSLSTSTATLPAKTQPATTQPTTPTGTGSASSGEAPKYGQCGGKNWNGATKCADGRECLAMNDWYS